MNEPFVARQIAQTLMPEAQWASGPVQLLTDSEWVNRGLDPAALVRQLKDRRAGPQVFVESLIPGVRTLAMLFAARRRRDDPLSPTHFTDEADWMAARILMFGITRLVVSTRQLPIFDSARRRLQDVSDASGVELDDVLPVLDTSQADSLPLLSLWSAHLPCHTEFTEDLTSVLDATLALQQHFTDRTKLCLTLFA